MECNLCTCELFLVYVHVFGDCAYAHVCTEAMLILSKIHEHTYSDQFFMMLSFKECCT